MFTIENFARGITNAVRNLNAEVKNDTLVITKNTYDYEKSEIFPKRFAKIPTSEFQSLLEIFKTDYDIQIPMVAIKKCFETAIQSQHIHRPSSFVWPTLENLETSEHNYHFTISQASQQYLFALFCSFHNCSDQYDITPMRMRSSMRITEEEIVDIADFFNVFNMHTLKITSPQEHSISEFKCIFDAYIFNIAHNLNISLAIADFESERASHIPRHTHHGQFFPYKKYKPDLTKYYHQAISSGIPFTQYLAFYHVAEFFFQTISEDEAFQVIRDFITRPSFSPYSQKDIRNFYKTIKKKIRDQRDNGVWDEQNGLLLCLKRYVPSLSDLKNSINRIDDTSVNYYKTTAVPFADKGNTIDFDTEPEKVYAAIRNRIYATRNAIVHSKEGEKSKYEPFKHDKQLAKELPLIRAVAEEIIINSAEPINYNFTEQ